MRRVFPEFKVAGDAAGCERASLTKLEVFKILLGVDHVIRVVFGVVFEKKSVDVPGRTAWR